MKFTCDQCGTRYTLSDEKVRNKVLKIRCKVCEHIMVVRDPGAQRTPAAPPPPPGGPSPLQRDAEWYAAAAGMQHGPMPLERLLDELRSRQVSADDLVWNASMDDWRPAREVPELAVALRRRPAPTPAPRFGPPEPAADDEATIIQGSPELFRFEATRGPEELLTREVSAAVNALHPVDTPAGQPTVVDEEADTNLWPELEAPAHPEPPSVGPAIPDPSAPPSPRPPPSSRSPLSVSSAAPAFTPSAPSPPPAALEASAESTAPATPAPQSPALHSPAPQSPALHSPAPQSPSPKSPAPAAPPASGSAEGDWMAHLSDHLSTTPVAQGTGQMAAIVQATPTPSRPWGRLALAALLLLGFALLLMRWSLDPEPGQAPDAALAAVAPQPDAAPPPVDAAVPDAAVPDAAVPDAAAPDAAPRPQAKVEPPKPKPTKREAATPASTVAAKRPASQTGLAALDQRKGAEVAPVAEAGERLPATLSKSEISGVIRNNKAGLQACYERQLKRDNSMRGVKLDLKFTVEGSGRASQVDIPRRFENTTLKTCLTSLVLRWRFPRFTGEPIPVEYPLVFQASL